MILSKYDEGRVRWYHVHPQYGWVVPCPTLELILVYDNLLQTKKKPTTFDAIRVCYPDVDALEPTYLKQMVLWFNQEILPGLPMSYEVWLTYVYELCNQQFDPDQIESWGRQPLRLVISAFKILEQRKKPE